MMGTVLDRVIRIGLLYDFYSGLLTEKQKECLNMHYLQDLSLAEIAGQFGTSRQAVHDILRRAEQALEEYEAKLGLLQKHQKERRLLQEIGFLLNTLPAEAGAFAEIRAIAGKLKEFDLLLENFREV